jgi:hypothetical protein
LACVPLCLPLPPCPLPLPLQCCIRHDGVWAPYAEAGHTCGKRSAALNIWSAPVSIGSMPELRVNGIRVPRARYPNGNPETDQFPVGWVPSGGETWHPPKPWTLPLVEVRTAVSRQDRGGGGSDPAHIEGG